MPYCNECGRQMRQVGKNAFRCHLHPQPSAASQPKIVAKGGGYYDVIVDGRVVNDKGIRGEDNARAFADSL